MTGMGEDVWGGEFTPSEVDEAVASVSDEVLALRKENEILNGCLIAEQRETDILRAKVAEQAGVIETLKDAATELGKALVICAVDRKTIMLLGGGKVVMDTVQDIVNATLNHQSVVSALNGKGSAT